MKKIVILACMCIALFPCPAAGQCTSSQEKPAWLDGNFNDLNNSYIKTVSATGYTEAEARNKAAAIAIGERELETGLRVNVQVGGDITVSGKDELTVKARVLEAYCEGQYRVSLLVQIAKNPGFDFERLDVTPKYDFSPRVFVPGLAQIHKGSKTKGTFFIAGEIALVGGIVITESLKASYQSKINTTHDAKTKQDYITKSDNMGNVSNVLIAGAAALYLWNVIDGIAAKGKTHVVVLGQNNLQITPFAAPDLNGGATGGLTLSFNF